METIRVANTEFLLPTLKKSSVDNAIGTNSPNRGPGTIVRYYVAEEAEKIPSFRQQDIWLMVSRTILIFLCQSSSMKRCNCEMFCQGKLQTEADHHYNSHCVTYDEDNAEGSIGKYAHPSTLRASIRYATHRIHFLLIIAKIVIEYRFCILKTRECHSTDERNDKIISKQTNVYGDPLDINNPNIVPIKKFAYDHIAKDIIQILVDSIRANVHNPLHYFLDIVTRSRRSPASGNFVVYGLDFSARPRLEKEILQLESLLYTMISIAKSRISDFVSMLNPVIVHISKSSRDRIKCELHRTNKKQCPSHCRVDPQKEMIKCIRNAFHAIEPFEQKLSRILADLFDNNDQKDSLDSVCTTITESIILRGITMYRCNNCGLFVYRKAPHSKICKSRKRKFTQTHDLFTTIDIREIVVRAHWLHPASLEINTVIDIVKEAGEIGSDLVARTFLDRFDNGSKLVLLNQGLSRKIPFPGSGIVEKYMKGKKILCTCSCGSQNKAEHKCSIDGGKIYVSPENILVEHFGIDRCPIPRKKFSKLRSEWSCCALGNQCNVVGCDISGSSALERNHIVTANKPAQWSIESTMAKGAWIPYLKYLEGIELLCPAHHALETHKQQISGLLVPYPDRQHESCSNV